MDTLPASVDASSSLLHSIIQQLPGTWKLDRRLESSNASEPSGRCYGQAVFTTRSPSQIFGKPASFEMVYHETGEFELSSGASQFAGILKLPFSRKYIWRLNAKESLAAHNTSGVSIWFAKPGSGELDYLFHDLSPPTVDGFTNLVVQGDHLCVNDMYNSEYIFHLHRSRRSTSGGQEDATLMEWKAKHIVVGPLKNQRIETVFKR